MPYESHSADTCVLLTGHGKGMAGDAMGGVATSRLARCLGTGIELAVGEVSCRCSMQLIQPPWHWVCQVMVCVLHLWLCLVRGLRPFHHVGRGAGAGATA